MSELQPHPSDHEHPIVPRAGERKESSELSDALAELQLPGAARPAEGFGGFLHSLRRQWLPGLGLGLLVASAVAAVLWFVIPANFEAVAMLQVGRENIFNQRSGGTTPAKLEEYKKNQQQLLRSRLVIDSALRNPMVSQLPMMVKDRFGRRRDDPADWLMGALSANYLGESALLRVTLRGENPDEIKAILAEVVRAYLEGPVRDEESARRNESIILGNEIAERTKKIDEIERDMASLTARFTTPNSALSQQKLIQWARELNEISTFRMESQRRRDRVMEDLEMYQLMYANRGINPPQWRIDDVLKASHPRFLALSEEIQMWEQQLAQMEQNQRPGSGGPSQIDQISNQLEEKRFELDNLRRELSPEAVQRIDTQIYSNTPEQDRVIIGALRQQLQTMNTRIEELDKAYQAKQEAIRDFEDGSTQLQNKMTQLATLTRERSDLQQQQAALNMRDRAGGQVVKIQDAFVPEVNNFWLKAAQVFGGAFFSLIGVLGLVAFTDFLAKRVNSREDLAQLPHVDVVASLPQLTPYGSAALLPLGSRRRQALEIGLTRSVDSLRAMLTCRRDEHAYKSLLITSAGAQEGKTTLASQLAASLAKAGKKTLLVDADFHNPQIPPLVGISRGPGLCEVLRSQIDVNDAVQPTRVEHLWCLQAGQRDDQIDFLLNNGRAQQVFHDLRQNYDYVVVDGGPVLSGPDCLLIAQYLDTALISVRRDMSRREKVEEACDRLKAISMPVFGIVYCGGGVELRGTDLSPARVSAQARRLKAPEAI